MDKIKSIEDLKKIREEALKKREVKMINGQTQIIVGMGTVGIAAGARETLKAILAFIEEKHLENIVVRQTGNIGMDSYEPIVQVISPDSALVSYGKVTQAMANEIMQEHVLQGNIVQKYVIPS